MSSKPRARRGRRPLVHDHAVRDVDEPEPRRAAAAVRACAVSAGTIASSSGSDSAAPDPAQERPPWQERLRATNIMGSRDSPSPIQRSASGTARWSRSPSRATRTGSRPAAESRTMARTAGMSYVLEPAAERVRQQLLGDGADEHLGPLQQRLAQRHRAVHASCRRPARPRRRSAGRRRACASAPTASKFSSASPIGSITLWQLAHAGFARCCSIRCAHRLRRRRRRLGERRHDRPAAAAAASRSGCRGSTCRARPATCGRRAT